jgi:hypothetical protein
MLKRERSRSELLEHYFFGNLLQKMKIQFLVHK